MEIDGKNYRKGERVWLRRYETTYTDTKVSKIEYSTADAPPYDSPFPVATAYEHMNYGTWTSLKEDKDGNPGSVPADMGAGFVRTLAGKSMTTDMPSTGTATYQGHWVGNARAAHAEGTGAITEVSGGSKTTATFGTAMTIKVELMKDDTDMFATLNGKIMGNRFQDAGTAANEVTVNNSVGEVKAGGKFTGSFSGAFFGPDAVEAGGVFDYTSEGKKHGEFRGAFGGRKM